MPKPAGEVHRVLFVDGIWLTRDLAALIVCDGERVASWHIAESEANRARSSLSQLVSQGTLFTYLDPSLAAEGPLSRTINPIEGEVNAQLRDELGTTAAVAHAQSQGGTLVVLMHTKNPRPARELLRTISTDDNIDLLCRTYSTEPKREDGGPNWGDGAAWEKLHRKDPHPFWLD